MKKLGIFIALAVLIGLVACEDDDEMIYTNGTYKAELSDFSHGWKEFMEVTIKDDDATVVNYDAIDTTGLVLKSSLTVYPMPDPPGLPSKWYPLLEAQFEAANIKDYEEVDGITGATGTSTNAKAMFKLILDAAKDGDTSTQLLPLE